MTFRDLPDWDPDPEDDTDACAACRRGQYGCSCLRSEETPDPDMEALEASPEGQGWAPAFSVQVSQEYARELAETLVRCRMNEAARMRHIREFAEVVKQVFIKEFRPAGGSFGTRENANA
jgi:hypothetical protein